MGRRVYALNSTDNSLQEEVVRASLVDLDAIPPGAAPTLGREGVMGEDPRASTVEFGARQLDWLVHTCAPWIREMLEERS